MFEDTLIPGYVLLSMVSNGESCFLLNGKKYKKEALFFLLLSEKDFLELIQVENYGSAQRFSFFPLDSCVGCFRYRGGQDDAAVLFISDR